MQQFDRLTRIVYTNLSLLPNKAMFNNKRLLSRSCYNDMDMHYTSICGNVILIIQDYTISGNVILIIQHYTISGNVILIIQHYTI